MISLDQASVAGDTRNRFAFAKFFIRFSLAALCAPRVTMRKLQSSISSVVNVAVLCGGVLIVCVEDVRSLCANFLSTLRIAASYLGIIANDALWRVSGTKWLKAMKCPAHCTATANAASATPHRNASSLALHDEERLVRNKRLRKASLKNSVPN